MQGKGKAMPRRLGRRPSRSASLVLAAIVFVAAYGIATVALAVEAGAQLNDSQLTVTVGGTVFAEKCDPCHGNIAETKNFSSSIIFKHGYHQLVQCSACHTRFPHRPEGTETPTMKSCFNCHGLRHGPMGLIATGDCSKCHLEPRTLDTKPAFHTVNWAEKPHVAPAEKDLNTQCMMCHTGQFCDDCHIQKDINWAPPTGYYYDSSDGCFACHGSDTLVKTAGGVPKSFQVTGVTESAHQDTTCQQCHIDYAYEDKTLPSKLWNVNVGYACASCKQHEKENAAYQKSIHAEQINQGNMNSATCASCHGGHYIQRLDTAAAKALLHASAYRVCARCHKEQYDTYNDYYHGAAYKKGAADAPACWQCHGAHDVLPSSDPKSMVYSKNLTTTCGQAGCHRRSAEDFTNAAKTLIHQKVQAVETNPLRRVLATIKGWFS
jgi:hypothetical protein